MATSASERVHTCVIFDPPGQHAGDEDRYDVECDDCGFIASADSHAEAEAMVRLHEQFVAVLVDKWGLES
jgi:hypothetical protein